MAGGYAAPAPGDLSALYSELKDLRRRVAELERPTGTQNLEAVALLAQQQVYAATDGGAHQTGPGNANYTNMPSITFEVDRPMRVLGQVYAPFESTVPTSVTAQVLIDIRTQGPVGPEGTLLQLFDRWVTTGFGLSLNRTANDARATTVLPGVHTWRLQGSVGLSGGSAGIDFVTGLGCTLVVSVLGEA